MKKTNIVIIGGGFSGLLIAYLLQKEGMPSQILEARERLGGRIYTLRSDDAPPLEMGATWLGKKHHNFSPSLPDELTDIASQTHTWMAESIKVALTFEEPFWRNPDSSGTIFSNVGPVSEMYDHSTDNHFALKGFMNNAYYTVSCERRKQLVIAQLRRFFGQKVDSYLSYRELVWEKEPFTYSNYDQSVVPHQNNGHEIFQKAFLENRLLIAGSETATKFPGYMDGVVESAQRTVRHLKELLPDNLFHLWSNMNAKKLAFKMHGEWVENGFKWIKK